MEMVKGSKNSRGTLTINSSFDLNQGKGFWSGLSFDGK
jgi:hypothetical protein